MPRAHSRHCSVSVDCDVDGPSVRSIAWVAIGTYAFGLIAFNGVLLVMARNAILSGKCVRT